MEMPDGSKVPLCDFYSVLHPTTADVVCRYDGEGGLDMRDGKPGAALTVNCYGKGKVICAGTEIFRQYAVDPQKAMTDFLMEQIADTGILPDVVLEGETENVEAVRLSGEDGQVLYILINHSDCPARVWAKVRECGAQLEDIVGGETYPQTFAKLLQPWQTLALCVRDRTEN
jgi:hypothetical protein